MERSCSLGPPRNSLEWTFLAAISTRAREGRSAFLVHVLAPSEARDEESAMSDAYSGGDLVVEILEHVGVDTAFGLTSVHNIPILDAMGRRNAIRFVMARGEMGAGHMADAYARVSGKLPVLITSTGPGAANVVPALMEARAA